MIGLLDFRATLAERSLDLELQLPAGERVALVGPNGAGKSSVLALLAGTLRPDLGRAELGGRLLFDLGPGATGRWLPPWQRGIALLAQDPLLFPHLSVLDNVAFAPRARGLSTAAARRQASSWLEVVEAEELAGRRPAQLSGGQAQRVAIARALAAEPQLLLLDEPLAALDVRAAPLLRRVLRRVLADRSAIVVTHDLLDASLIADRVVVLDGGRIRESGPTAEVLRHPRSPFTAGLAGLNLIAGRQVRDGSRHGVRDASGQVLVGISADGRELPSGRLDGDEPAVAVFSPTAVGVYRDTDHRVEGSPRNVRVVTITELEPRDQLVRLRAEDAGGAALLADVTTEAVADLDLYPGRTVSFTIKATAVTIHLT